MRNLTRAIGAAAVALALASPWAPVWADAIITHNLTTTITSPIAAGSCFYVDLGPGTDAKLCNNYAAALGAIPLNGNAGTPTAINLGSGVNLPISGISGLSSGMAAWFAAPSSLNLRSTVTDETGSGPLVFAVSPAFTTPDLGTPSAAVLTNATGLPLTGTTGTLPFNRLAVTGSPTGAKFVRDDGALAVPPGGGSPSVTDGVTSLTASTFSFDSAFIDVIDAGGGTATIKSVCPVAVGALGDINSAISSSSGKAKINATLTAARTYTLPAASAIPNGCSVLVYDESRTVSASNTATIQRAGSDTINGGTTFPAITAGGFWTAFVSDGASKWTQVNSGVLPTLSNGQVYCGTANITANCTMSGDSVLASGGALTNTGIQGRTVPAGATTDGQLLIGNTATGNWSKAALTAGANVTITNSGGGITIAATGGSGTPAGSNGDFQTNSSGSFGALTPAAGMATFLSTPSSLNLRAAMTDETGTGSAVFATSPTLTTPNLGTPTAAVGTNFSGVPLSAHLTQAASTVVANATGGSAAPTAVTLGTGLAFSSGALAVSGSVGRISSYGDADTTLAVGDHYVGLGATNWTLPKTYTLPLVSGVADGDTIEIADDQGVLNGQTLTIAVQGGNTLKGTTALNASQGRAYCKANATSSTWSCWSGIPNSGSSGQILVGQGTTTPGNWVTPSGDITSISSIGAVLIESLNGNIYPAAILNKGILYGSSNFNVGQLSVVNGALVNTSSAGVPSETITPVLGVAATSAGTLGLANSAGSGKVVTIQNPSATAANYNFNLPATAGTSGQHLASGAGGSTAMTWSTPTQTYEDHAQHSHTGDTTETVLAGCPVPAGILGATGTIRLVGQLSRVAGGTSSITIKFKFGAANDTTGTQLFSFTMGTSTISQANDYTLYNRTASSQVGTPSVNLGGGSSALATSAINTANASYLNITGTLATTTDTVSSEALTCQFIPPNGS